MSTPTATVTVHSLPHSWALYHYQATAVTPSLIGTITTIEDFWCLLSSISAPSFLPPGECYEWRCMTVFPATPGSTTYRQSQVNDEETSAVVMTALGEATPTRRCIVYVSPQCLIDVPFGVDTTAVQLRAFTASSPSHITIGTTMPHTLVWLQDAFGRSVACPGVYDHVKVILARPHTGELRGTTQLRLSMNGEVSFNDLSLTMHGETMLLFTCKGHGSDILTAHVPPFMVPPLPTRVPLRLSSLNPNAEAFVGGLSNIKKKKEDIEEPCVILPGAINYVNGRPVFKTQN